MYIRLNSLRLAATTCSQEKPDLACSKVLDVGTIETSSEFARCVLHEINGEKYLVIIVCGQEILVFRVNKTAQGQLREDDVQLVWRFIDLEV